jgi:hypothetical protein
MRKFEYRSVEIQFYHDCSDMSGYTLDELNKLGADGWEVVAVVKSHALLKREVSA